MGFVLYNFKYPFDSSDSAFLISSHLPPSPAIYSHTKTCKKQKQNKNNKMNTKIKSLLEKEALCLNSIWHRQAHPFDPAVFITKPCIPRTVGPKECCAWLPWNMPGSRQLWFNWCMRLLPPCPISHQLLHYRKNYTREMKMQMQNENREEHKLSNHMWLTACNISASLEGQTKAGREDFFLQKTVVISISWIQESRCTYFWEDMLITQITCMKKKPTL